MGIAPWIFKTAEEPHTVNLSDKGYDSLLQKYRDGNMDPASADALEEIEYLRDLINVASSKLLERDGKEVKEAAAEKPQPTSVPSKVEVPPEMPSGAKLPEKKNSPGKLPARPNREEPESTKWKEIRFNKKDGKWQIVTTTRVVRNYNSEDEALDAAKNL